MVLHEIQGQVIYWIVGQPGGLEMVVLPVPHAEVSELGGLTCVSVYLTVSLTHELSFYFKAKSLGRLETKLHQAVLPHCRGPCQSEEGDLPCCEEEPRAGPCQ